jgi:predicted amidohydrolase YtcJ
MTMPRRNRRSVFRRETSSIEPGKLADLVVLDRNLFDLSAEQIHEARVTWTLLEGETVYQRR